MRKLGQSRARSALVRLTVGVLFGASCLSSQSAGALLHFPNWHDYLYLALQQRLAPVRQASPGLDILACCLQDLFRELPWELGPSSEAGEKSLTWSARCSVNLGDNS